MNTKVVPFFDVSTGLSISGLAQRSDLNTGGGTKKTVEANRSLAAKISLPRYTAKKTSDRMKLAFRFTLSRYSSKKISVLAHREEKLEAPVIDYGLLQGPGPCLRV